jgi:hypothetical protein
VGLLATKDIKKGMNLLTLQRVHIQNVQSCEHLEFLQEKNDDIVHVQRGI